MDVVWTACLTAVAVMIAVPALATMASALWQGLVGARRRRRVVQLRLPLRDNPAEKLSRLRESLGLHG